MGFLKNIIDWFKKEQSDKVKIIFNMPRKDFKEMVEKEIIPYKTFSVALGKKEVLKLMEKNENEYELNYDDCKDEIISKQSLQELEKE